MGLELDEAEHYLGAGALEVAGPLDIGLLVESGLELDQRHDGFAGLGGLDESGHDRAVVRGAVERLLDGDDIGVLRCLLDELHHHVEGSHRDGGR